MHIIRIRGAWQPIDNVREPAVACFQRLFHMPTGLIPGQAVYLVIGYHDQRLKPIARLNALLLSVGSSLEEWFPDHCQHCMAARVESQLRVNNTLELCCHVDWLPSGNSIAPQDLFSVQLIIDEPGRRLTLVK